LEKEIEDRASKAIVLNDYGRNSIAATDRDFFDASSKIDNQDIPSNQQQAPLIHE